MKPKVKLAMAARYHQGIVALRNRIAAISESNGEADKVALALLTATLADFGASMPVKRPDPIEMEYTEDSKFERDADGRPVVVSGPAMTEP